MKLLTPFILLPLFSIPLLFHHAGPSDDWGFYAHRKINQLAVYTLPVDMLYLYKKNIDYLKEHAVDPDKRRYASVFEGIRHYIDLDHWEKQWPLDTLPNIWSKALFQYSSIFSVQDGDTIYYKLSAPIDWESEDQIMMGDRFVLTDSVLSFFENHIMPQYYDEEWYVDADTFEHYLGIKTRGSLVYFRDHFSEHGVLPFHLEHMQYRLTRAFEQNDHSLILRLSAEMGHYIGDAHVPLHTTQNYNGQMTGQTGIHAFWESRIPELFAQEDYDFFVGRADYIRDKKAFFWGMVKSSHQLVDSVLSTESRLRKEFPENAQMCFDERLGRTVLTQCEEFARAYQSAMNGMVEDRMRASISAVGSSWYTAWVDAGQPKLSKLQLDPENEMKTEHKGSQTKDLQRLKKRPHSD